MNNAVIVDVVRTASGRGKAGGALADVHPVDLLATVLRAVVERNDLDPAAIDDVIGGCVSQNGDQALNVTRSGVLAAGLAETVPATTIDRQCGSSQQAVHFAAQGVMAGVYDTVIACGVESMSRVPMFSNAVGGEPQAPLARRYPEGLIQQGISAELIAARWGLDRDRLDAFAVRSHELASAAADDGAFAREIVPVDVDGATDGPVLADQTIRQGTTPEGLAKLRPAFEDAGFAERFPEIGWAITPGNSSPLTDGASAVLIMSEQRAEQLGLTPRARFAGFSVVGSDPLTMLDGIVPATRQVLSRAGLTIDQVDAFEVNEAFASVPLMWQQELDADPEKLNPRGGAIALGHPLGASGGRLLATLLHHLEDSGGRYGLQTMCEGGGMANATVIERV